MADHLEGQRILVTGAGLVGTRLIADLARERAKEIRVLDASEQRLRALGSGFDPVVADVADRAAMAAATDGIDVVFHTAAVLEGNDVAAYHRVNHTGSEVVASAAAAAGVRRFVHLSSITVYGYAKGDVTEDRPVTPKPEAYSASKAAGEAAVRRIGGETGMGVTAIRPAGVFGPGSRYFSGTFMRRAMHRPIRMIGNGKGSQPVVFVDDLIDLMMTCATHPAAAGEVFNCAIDPSPTVKEYVHAYGKLVGNETWLGIPANLVATLGSVIIPFQKKGTYGHHLFKNVRMMNHKVRYHMDKAQRLLDWAPRYDVKSGVAATVPWLKEQGILPA